MLEKLKKKSIIKSLPAALILLVTGIALFGAEISNMKSLLRGHVVFESLAPEEINGDLIVDVTLYDNFGCYMEQYEENTKTHARHTTDLYYVIWTGDENAQDFRYMGIKVPASDEYKMEEMAEATYYGEYSDPIKYSGAVNKMTSEEYEYFKEYFLESDFTEEELDDWTLPYYINVGALTGGAATSAWIIAGLGGALFLAGVFLLVLALTGGKLKTFKKELAQAGFEEGSVDYEYEGARLFNKKSDFRVGRRLTFFLIGSKPHVVANDKLVWVYQSTTTHRTNGIKTGTTYAVMLRTFDKKSFTVAVSNEGEAQEALQYISQTIPGAVVGYDDELNKMYQRDFQNFLQLKYNQRGQDDTFQV